MNTPTAVPLNPAQLAATVAVATINVTAPLAEYHFEAIRKAYDSGDFARMNNESATALPYIQQVIDTQVVYSAAVKRQQTAAPGSSIPPPIVDQSFLDNAQGIQKLAGYAQATVAARAVAHYATATVQLGQLNQGYATRIAIIAATADASYRKIATDSIAYSTASAATAVARNKGQ